MDEGLVHWLASVSNDPYAYVMGAFPWGEPGTRLEKFSGPETWQEEKLKLVRDLLATGMAASTAIQIATASGHGVGKSALVAWLIKWGIDFVLGSIGFGVLGSGFPT